MNGPDLITQLGYLCLGSRLKRLGEGMQAGVAQHLAARGLAVLPAQLPLLWALGEADALTIGALGERLGISQPGVSRAVAVLEAEGLVTVSGEARDKRRRVVAISPAGAALMADLKATLFPAVEDAVGALCDATGADLLAAIGAIEAELDRQSLAARIADAGEGRA